MVVKNLFDVLTLAELKQRGCMGGYALMSLIREKFHVLISPGTVYRHLYSLERDGLVKGIEKDGRKKYDLTAKGEEAVAAIVDEGKVFFEYLANLKSFAEHQVI